MNKIRQSLKEYSFCRICEAACGLAVTIDNGKIIGVKGDKKHPLSRGYLCPKGSALAEFQNDPDRLKSPLKRVGAGFERISWSQAISEVGDGLKDIIKKFGPRAIAVYNGAPSFFAAYGWRSGMAFIRALGSPNHYTPWTLDDPNKGYVPYLIYGTRLFWPLLDTDNANCIMLIGANPAESQNSQGWSRSRNIEHLINARKRGAKLIVVDPRCTKTSKIADIHVQIIPGRDPYFLLGLINVISGEGIYDKDYVDRYCTGFNSIKEISANYTPERVESLTGISSGKIIEVARTFANAKGACARASTGVSQGRFPNIGEWLVHVLNITTGNVDKKGGIYYNPGVIYPLTKGAMPEKMTTGLKTRVRGYQDFFREFPCSVLADEILTPGNGQIRALIVNSGNPLISLPNETKLEKAFQSLDLMVTIDLCLSDTAGLSDYVLPTTTFFERADLSFITNYTYPMPFIQYGPKLAKPSYEQKPEWEIFKLLSEKLHIPFMNDPEFDRWMKEQEKIYNETSGQDGIKINDDVLLDRMLSKSKVTLDEVKKHPHGLKVGEKKYGWFIPDLLMTSDKTIHLAPHELLNEFKDRKFQTITENPEFPYYLIDRRVAPTMHTWFHNYPSIRKIIPENFLTINPQDAKKLKLRDGGKVKVSNKQGSLEVKVRISDEAMVGVVSLHHGWGHKPYCGWTLAKKTPGVNYNRLTDDEKNCDPATGMVQINGINVKIAAI